MSTAFQPEMYRAYLAIWARICLRNVGYLRGKLDTSDIVQDALLQACLALPQFRGSTEGEFAAWLREILQNKFLDLIKYYARDKRDVKREQQLQQTLTQSSINFAKRLERIVVSPQTDTVARIFQTDKVCKLAVALAVLPEDQRTAIELHHLQDLSLEETARLMNRTRASVAGLLRRGLEGMRAALG